MKPGIYAYMRGHVANSHPLILYRFCPFLNKIRELVSACGRVHW